MTAINNVLYVEDTRAIALNVQGIFEDSLPQYKLKIVEDAENAVKAVMGKDFQEWNPATGKFADCKGLQFRVVLWDDMIPEKPGAGSMPGVGFETVKSLIDKVDLTATTFVFASTGDADFGSLAAKGVKNFGKKPTFPLLKALFKDIESNGQPAADSKKPE